MVKYFMISSVPVFSVWFSNYVALAENENKKEKDVNLCEHLLQAVLAGNREKVQDLLHSQPRHFHEPCVDSTRRCALSIACSKGYVDIAQLLLKAGYDVNSRDKHNLAPLSYASWKGQGNAVRFLIENGAEVFHQDDFGVTAIHKAAAFGHTLVMEQLLGAAYNKGGASALKKAVNLQTGVISAPPQYEAKTLHQTPLHLALRGSANITEMQRKEMVKLLLSYGAEPNIPDVNGNNALHYAVQTSHLGVLIMIMEAGGDSSQENKRGQKPEEGFMQLPLWESLVPWSVFNLYKFLQTGSK